MEESNENMQTDVRVLGVMQLRVLLIHCRSDPKELHQDYLTVHLSLFIFLGWKESLCQENCLAHECHISKTRVLCGEQ